MPQVEEICQRLDRLPLAIELAAMHVKVLALPVLLERFEQSAPAVGWRSGGPSGAPARDAWRHRVELRAADTRTAALLSGSGRHWICHGAWGTAWRPAARVEQAHAEARDSSNSIAIGLALLNLGEHARLRGDLGRARALHEESLERSRAAGSTWATACVLTLLGHVARDQGDHPLVRSRYGESLLLLHDLGNRTYQAACLEGCAALALTEGDAERAATLCAFAAGLRGQAGTPLPPNEQQAFDATLSSARRALGEEAFGGAWSRGESFSDEEGMAFALAYLGQPCPAE